jgi:GNAT superfamily N-acetyltransferase
MSVEIRDATPNDEAAWRGLWSAYLAFYKVGLDPAITDHTWARLMLPSSPLKARLAVEDGTVLGFAIRQNHPSTWVLGDDCYLEDLFITDAARGRGIGRALIEDLMALARSNGWHRLYWHTDEANTNARQLYDRIVKSDGHIRYRLKL